MPPNPDNGYLKLYRALCDAPTYGSILRARVLAVLHRRGETLTSLAERMGRGRATYARKLNADHSATRALTAGDIDEILVHLGLAPSVLLLPVLHDHDDHALLRDIENAEQYADGGGLLVGAPTTDLAEAYDGLDLRLARLEAQGLIVRRQLAGGVDWRYAITPVAGQIVFQPAYTYTNDSAHRADVETT